MISPRSIFPPKLTHHHSVHKGKKGLICVTRPNSLEDTDGFDVDVTVSSGTLVCAAAVKVPFR